MKNEIVEILSLLSAEATFSKENRRVVAMKPILKRLSDLVGLASGLGSLWDRIKPIIESVFQ